MEKEFLNWEINYISCEGNERWTVSWCPAEWNEYEVETAFRDICYGVGDDPTEFVSCMMHHDHDWDEATYYLDENNLN
jgi:hypothetical protein